MAWECFGAVLEHPRPPSEPMVGTVSVLYAGIPTNGRDSSVHGVHGRIVPLLGKVFPKHSLRSIENKATIALDLWHVPCYYQYQ